MSESVIMFSGGLGSWLTARRVRDQHGTDNLTLLFADVGGDRDDPHAGEDEDTYRFLDDAAADIGVELTVIKDGRTIWQVFHDDRFLGNSRLANCSKHLKQIPAREWLDANCDPATTTVYIGIDWTETHRLPAVERSYDPYPVRAPMTEPPYLDKSAMQLECLRAGIELPRLYRAGFPHNNCGGGCVRAGQAQFELLLREHPERFASWERHEQELRDDVGKDVSILRDRSKGTTTPLTLRSFREGIQSQTLLFDPNDFGGCGCFVQGDGEVADA